MFKEKIKQILDIYLSDNTNAYELQADEVMFQLRLRKELLILKWRYCHVMKDEAPKIKICDVLMPILK